MMGARRDATLKNMVKSLIEHEQIETILARAKEARRVAEPLITLSKTDTVDSRRRAYMVLGDRDAVGRLFKEIAPLFKNRTSGFTRIIPTGFRRGDGASMAILELTEKTVVVKTPKKKKEKAQTVEPKTDTRKAEAAPAADEKKRTAAAVKAEEPAKEHKAEEHKPKAHKAKMTQADEKRAEKAKSEDMKASENRGFMKNIRGLFRKRGDR